MISTTSIIQRKIRQIVDVFVNTMSFNCLTFNAKVSTVLSLIKSTLCEGNGLEIHNLETELIVPVLKLSSIIISSKDIES